MSRILISELHDHIGKEVTIAGWVNVRRDHGKLVFIDLRDRTGVVQMVVLPNHESAHALAEQVRSEWVLRVQGKVNQRPEKMKNTNSPTGDIELEVVGIEVLNEAAEIPFELDADLNIDTLLDHRPLTLRRERDQRIFKVAATIVKSYREALKARDFVEFQAPVLVGSDAEGGANVFRVDYLKDKDAYLATSPQLYKQVMVGVYERAFTVAKVFRAEKHATTRHLNEYTSLDAEMGFIADHQDVMEVLGYTVTHIAQMLQEHEQDTLKHLEVAPLKVPDTIPHMKLREAQVLIKKETGEDCTNDPDLSPEQERFLSDYAAKEYASDFLFVTHYPVSKRPFYTYEDESDPGFTKSFDLLFRGVEIATGGQRIHDYDLLVQKLTEKNLNPDAFAFYLEAFKYGMPPHGGWGMGFERLVSRFLGLSNVREATLFPRDINRIDTLLHN